MFASVVVDIASSNVDQLYEYFCPVELSSLIKVGSRVKVEFGNSGKVILGFVLDLYDESKFNGPIKEIKEILDVTPLITPKQLQIASYLKDNCICPLIRILDLMIPEALRLKSMKYLEATSVGELDATLVPLFEKSHVIPFDKSLNPYLTKIKKEIQNGNLKISYDAVANGNFKYVKKYYVDKANYDFNIVSLRSENQRRVLEEMINFDKLTKLEICEIFGVSLSVVNALIKKGYLKEYSQKESRVKKRIVENINSLKEINDDELLKTINSFSSSEKPYLYLPKDSLELNEVIIRLVLKELENNKNVVILCSDILSSYKYSSLIYQALKIQVACLNSNLSKGEYLDYYFEIINNDYKVIVTTPKGAFLPYSNVGLYLMLDADGSNYYNDQSPRYDLKQVFSYISYLDNAKYIMVSFTPMISEYCYSLHNDLTLVNNQKMQEHHQAVVVDLKKEFKTGNDSYLSLQVKDALLVGKKNNHKSIVIINNKLSGYVICKTCGNVNVCSKCGVSLQYNDKNKMLICPHCGYRTPFNSTCSKCGSSDYAIGGIGIESFVNTLNKEVPSLKILDISSNKSFDEYLNKLEAIEEDNIDVIITTETYAKALELKNIQNVIIVNFDAVMKAPLLYSSSKAYDLLMTANRLINLNDGKIYIQTTDVANQIIKYFITDDFKGYLISEIENRKALNALPFYKVNRLIVKANYEEVFQIANNIKKALISAISGYHFVIGPTYSKLYSGVVIIVKHNDLNINTIYKKIYERYMSSTTTIIFDLYPRSI